MGACLGHSPAHAGSVALALNPTTGHASPQFHVVFDDDFAAVEHVKAGTVPANWSLLGKNSSELATDANFNLAETWCDAESTADERESSVGEANNLDLDDFSIKSNAPCDDDSRGKIGSSDKSIRPSGDNDLQMLKLADLEESRLHQSK